MTAVILPPVPNVLECQIAWTIGEDADAHTKIHFEYTGTPPSATDLQAISGDMFTAFDLHLPPMYSSSVALNAIVLTDLATADGARGLHTGSTEGSRVGLPLPAGVAVNFQWTIARRYRGGKPRGMLPFFVAGDLVAPQSWNAASCTAAYDAWTAWTTAISGASSGGTELQEQVSVSYFKGFTLYTNPLTGRARAIPILRVGGPVVDEIIGVGVSARPGTVRRRNGKSA